jgi:hypothetical protein
MPHDQGNSKDPGNGPSTLSSYLIWFSVVPFSAEISYREASFVDPDNAWVPTTR